MHGERDRKLNIYKAVEKFKKFHKNLRTYDRGRIIEEVLSINSDSIRTDDVYLKSFEKSKFNFEDELHANIMVRIPTVGNSTNTFISTDVYIGSNKRGHYIDIMMDSNSLISEIFYTESDKLMDAPKKIVGIMNRDIISEAEAILNNGFLRREIFNDQPIRKRNVKALIRFINFRNKVDFYNIIRRIFVKITNNQSPEFNTINILRKQIGDFNGYQLYIKFFGVDANKQAIVTLIPHTNLSNKNRNKPPNLRANILVWSKHKYWECTIAE